AVTLFEFGLVFPGIDLAGPAVHEEPDDRPGLRGKVSLPRGKGIHISVACSCRCQPAFLREKARQSEKARPASGALKEFAARTVSAIWRSEKQWHIHRRPPESVIRHT